MYFCTLPTALAVAMSSGTPCRLLVCLEHPSCFLGLTSALSFSSIFRLVCSYFPFRSVLTCVHHCSEWPGPTTWSLPAWYMGINVVPVGILPCSVYAVVVFHNLGLEPSLSITSSNSCCWLFPHHFSGFWRGMERWKSAET